MGLFYLEGEMQREERQPITFRLPESVHQDLTELAILESASLNDIVIQSIRRFKRNYKRQGKYAAGTANASAN